MWRAAFGLKNLSPNPAHHKMPVSSNVSQHQFPSLHDLKSFLTMLKFGFPNAAVLRRRSEISSLLALRAVARSAKSVQSVAARCAARRASDEPLAIEQRSANVTAGGFGLKVFVGHGRLPCKTTGSSASAAPEAGSAVKSRIQQPILRAWQRHLHPAPFAHSISVRAQASPTTRATSAG